MKNTIEGREIGPETLEQDFITQLHGEFFEVRMSKAEQEASEGIWSKIQWSIPASCGFVTKNSSYVRHDISNIVQGRFVVKTESGFKLKNYKELINDNPSALVYNEREYPTQRLYVPTHIISTKQTFKIFDLINNKINIPTGDNQERRVLPWEAISNIGISLAEQINTMCVYALVETCKDPEVDNYRVIDDLNNLRSYITEGVSNILISYDLFDRFIDSINHLKLEIKEKPEKGKWMPFSAYIIDGTRSITISCIDRPNTAIFLNRSDESTLIAKRPFIIKNRDATNAELVVNAFVEIGMIVKTGPLLVEIKEKKYIRYL